MKGGVVADAMMYIRRLFTLRVYIPTTRKIIRETTERGMPTSWTCNSENPNDLYTREPKVVSSLCGCLSM